MVLSLPLLFMVCWNGARCLSRHIPGLGEINPDSSVPWGGKHLGSPVAAPAPGLFSPLTATSHLICKAPLRAAGHIAMCVQYFA